MQFLMKVNENYSNTRSNILMMNPLPPISQAYRLLVQEQKHKEISTAQQNSEALVFSTDSQRTFVSEASYTKYSKPYKAGIGYQATNKSNAITAPLGRTYTGKKTCIYIFLFSLQNSWS